MPEPRLAKADDLPALVVLEKACYDPPRRSSRASLRRSISSPRQEVWILDDEHGLAAGLILWWYEKTVRIYGVQVHPSCQGRGIGASFLQFAERRALRRGRRRIILEADAASGDLLRWYEHHGYVRRGLRPDFYGVGRDAWRMEKRLA